MQKKIPCIHKLYGFFFFFLGRKNFMGLNDYTGSVYIHMYNGHLVSTVKFAYNEIVNISNPCEPPFFNWYVSL